MIQMRDLNIQLKLRDFLYTLLMNAVIAVFLTAMDFGRGFFINLVYSQCIGISIYLCIYAVLAVFKTAAFMQRLMLVILAMIVGAVAGMTAAALGLGADRILVPDGQFKVLIQTILSGLLFGSIISYIFISREKVSMANELAMEEKIKRLALENKSVESEFQLLQSQTEPHFLFNTLSNVIGLIDTSPQKAKSMLNDFVHFLRASLSQRRDQAITISQEIEMIRRYLDILRIRMGNRLRFDIAVPDDLLQHRIPPLLIQPLVENAIKHGLEPRPEGGMITIRCSSGSGRMRIEVADSGKGIGESDGGTGIGIANIEKRLKLLYGNAGCLTLHERRPSGVSAVIEIPYENH